MDIPSASLHAADLRGDGRQSVVLLCAGRLLAFRDGIDKPLWTWPLPSVEGKVLAVRPATSVAPTTIIVESGNAIFGIAGTTGKVRWRCDGPGPLIGMLSEGDNGKPAAAAFAVNTATVCREALPTDDAGRCTIPDVGPAADMKPIPNPWLARPLPWVERGWLRDDTLAVLFVLELLLVWWAGWRKSALVLGGLVLLLGAGISVLMIVADVPKMDEEQHYALTDWYGVLSETASVAGMFLAICLALGLIWSRLVCGKAKLWRRKKPRSQ
jgi:hypothetical protein